MKIQDVPIDLHARFAQMRAASAVSPIPEWAQRADALSHLQHLLVAKGSIEERLLELQARKQALADGVLGEDAALAPKFGQAELDALLAPLG